MHKILFILCSLTTFPLAAFADNDENPDPLNEPGEFVGEALENTVSIATGAVVGTGQALGDMADSGNDEKENED